MDGLTDGAAPSEEVEGGETVRIKPEDSEKNQEEERLRETGIKSGRELESAGTQPHRRREWIVD